jgi:DNA invertase Pin-like site-specific DNA recombinase
MESGVEFICCDMPQANKLTLQIMGAMAEDESSRIRKRTKDALAVAKSKGVKLGNPHEKIRLKAGKKGNKAQNEEANMFAWEILPLIDGIKASGLTSLKDIADALNARGVTTQRGGTWYPSTVSNILKRRK